MVNETQVSIDLFNYLTNNKNFSQQWRAKKVSNPEVIDILSTATKSEMGKYRGEPDLIYLNENKKLLIIVECKGEIQNHEGEDVRKNATAGIKHYLKFFLSENLTSKKETTQKFLKDFRIIGVAFSGEIEDKLNHRIDTFIIRDDKVEDISTKQFLDEGDYIALFENSDVELIAENISKSSSEINRMLRNVDSQNRSVLLSALMICLYEKRNSINNFKRTYQNLDAEGIIYNIPLIVKTILREGGIPLEKIEVLNNQLSFIKTDNDLNKSNILLNILKELENNVIPLFNRSASYDIIGKFYEEFLRYAGISNVKKGIVLTPKHIADLFTELIPIKPNDKIFDACCGTGAFLISGMNVLINAIANSEMADKKNRIDHIKEKQLLGFEKSDTMFSLAVSNMLFRGDGKTKIHCIDFFGDEAITLLEKEKPTVGFINPPYGGLDNEKNPTKKEMQFLERILDNVSRYGLIIAPQSTFFKDDWIRNRILTKHTLKAVINMPKELFQPNTSVHTAISIFETNLPHNNKKVIFYDLKDDGLILSKNKGRVDAYNRWKGTKDNLLKKLESPEQHADNTNLVYKPIGKNDEWILQAHQKTDYSEISDEDFIKSIKEHIVFTTKLNLGLLDKKLDEISMIEILYKNNIYNKTTKYPKSTISLKSTQWQEFKIGDLFTIEKGERLTEVDRISGDIPLITASSYNNGITSFIDKDIFKDRKKLFKNKVTIDMFGNVFYHQYLYFSDDNIHTLIFNDELDINKYIQIFLITVLAKISSKYGFGRQLRLYRLKNEIISLPTKNHQPNWQFMESYIKSLPYSKSL